MSMHLMALRALERGSIRQGTSMVACLGWSKTDLQGG